MPQLRITFAAMIVVAHASLLASAAPLPYQLNVVAKTGDGRFALLNTPSLNGSGVAAFRATDAAGSGVVFDGTPGAVQQLPTPGLTVTPLSGHSDDPSTEPDALPQGVREGLQVVHCPLRSGRVAVRVGIAPSVLGQEATSGRVDQFGPA